jgi:cbb3-type cytochrome oxidase subunit 1
VLIFLVVILAGQYLGMMLISHTLLFGVIAILVSFAFYINNFFRQNFPHPALAFLLSGLALLLATSAYGILNIYFMKGISFGSYPPIRADKMWIYHSHTHAALLGWITLSFSGMIYIVIPSILSRNSLEALQSGDALGPMLEERTMKRAFIQLTVMLLSATGILLSLFFSNLQVMGACGLVFCGAIYFLRSNLLGDRSAGIDLNQ